MLCKYECVHICDCTTFMCGSMWLVCVHVCMHVLTEWMYIVHEQLTRQQTKQHNTTQHNDTRDNNVLCSHSHTYTCTSLCKVHIYRLDAKVEVSRDIRYRAKRGIYFPEIPTQRPSNRFRPTSSMQFYGTSPAIAHAYAQYNRLLYIPECWRLWVVTLATSLSSV